MWRVHCPVWKLLDEKRCCWSNFWKNKNIWIPTVMYLYKSPSPATETNTKPRHFTSTLLTSTYTLGSVFPQVEDKHNVSHWTCFTKVNLLSSVMNFRAVLYPYNMYKICLLILSADQMVQIRLNIETHQDLYPVQLWNGDLALKVHETCIIFGRQQHPAS